MNACHKITISLGLSFALQPTLLPMQNAGQLEPSSALARKEYLAITKSLNETNMKREDMARKRQELFQEKKQIKSNIIALEEQIALAQAALTNYKSDATQCRQKINQTNTRLAGLREKGITISKEVQAQHAVLIRFLQREENPLMNDIRRFDKNSSLKSTPESLPLQEESKDDGHFVDRSEVQSHDPEAGHLKPSAQHTGSWFSWR